MLSLKCTRPMAPCASLKGPDGRWRSHGFTAASRPAAIQGVRPRVKVTSSFRTGPTTRLAVVCSAASHAGNRPDMRKPDLLTNILHVIEIAVVPCFVVMLWKAASLPAEALLFAAYWGLQIAMPVPLLRKLGLGVNTSLAVSAALVGAMWSAITRCLLPAKDLMPLSVKADFSFTIPKIVWERISGSPWTHAPQISKVPFRLMTGPQRLAVLLPVLLSATVIAALLVVQKKVQGGRKTAVVAEPVAEPAVEPNPQRSALPPVSGWPLFGGGVGFGLSSLTWPSLLGPSTQEVLEAKSAGAKATEAESAATESTETEEESATEAVDCFPKAAESVAPAAEGSEFKPSQDEDADQPASDAEVVMEQAAATDLLAAEFNDPPTPPEKEHSAAKGTRRVWLAAHHPACEHSARRRALNNCAAGGHSASHEVEEDKRLGRELTRLTKTESPDLVEALLRMSQRLEVLENEKSPTQGEALEERVNKIEAQLHADANLSRVKELEEEVKGLNSKAYRLEMDYYEHEELIAKLKDGLVAERDNLEEGLQEMGIRLDDLQEMNEEEQAHALAAREALEKALRASMDLLEEQVDVQRLASSSLEGSVNVLKGNIASINSDQELLEDKLSELNLVTPEELQLELEAVLSKVGAQTSRIDDLAEQFTTLKDDIVNDQNCHEDRLNDLEEDFSAFKAIFELEQEESIVDQIKAAVEKIEGLEESVEALKINKESLDKISEPLEMAKALNGLLSDPSLRKALEVIADDAEPTSLAELLAWQKEHPPTVRIAASADKEASLATEGSKDAPQIPAASQGKPKEGDSFGVDVEVVGEGPAKINGVTPDTSPFKGVETEWSPSRDLASTVADVKQGLAPLLAPGIAGLGAGAALAGDSFSVKVEDVEEGAAEKKNDVAPLESAKEVMESTNGLKERPKWTGEEVSPAAAEQVAKKATEEDDYEIMAAYSSDDASDVEYGSDDDDFDDFSDEEVGSDMDYDPELDGELWDSDEGRGSDGEDVEEDEDEEDDYFDGRADEDDTVG